LRYLRSCRAWLLTTCCLALPSITYAGIPSVPESTIPPRITLGDVQNPAVCQLLVLRNANNNPIAYCPVTLDFSACAAADVRVCASQPDQPSTIGPQPASATCGSHVVTLEANPLGEVCLSLSGSSGRIDGNGPRAEDRPLCCAISSYGKPMGTAVVTVVRYDLNGDGFLNVNDLSVWLRLSGGMSGVYHSLGDYNGDGRLNIGDLSMWLTCSRARAGALVAACTAFCP
jgi:hypothetical protein